jgi:hypothetical protein
MPDIHIIVTGIIALVPRKAGGIRVIIPNTASHPNFPHIGHLLVEKSRVAKTDRPANATLIHPRTGNAISYWQLGGDEITINSMIGSGPLTIDPTYIASLPDILGSGTPATGDVAASILNSLDPMVVAARLDMAQGTLAATWVRTDYAWTFKLSSGDVGPMFLAQEVCLTSSTSDSQLSLTLTRFGGGSYQLKVKPNSSGRIEVRVGNLPQLEILPNVVALPKAKTDVDFGLYYDMASAVDETPLPVPSIAPPPPLPPYTPQDKHPHDMNVLPYVAKVASAKPGGIVQGEKQGRAEVLLHEQVSGGGTGGVGGVNCPPAFFNRA